MRTTAGHFSTMKNQIVIIGGGPSVSEGVEKNLWEKLNDKWTIGCNSIYKFLTPTVLTFVDYRQFYSLFRNEIKDIPYIVGKYYPLLEEEKHQNTTLLRVSREFSQDLKQGVYCGLLCGLFSISLAQYFLAQQGEIYLLGFDFGSNGQVEGVAKTHFYQGKEPIVHPGIGKDGFYKRVEKVKLFECFSKINGIKIYNVSSISTIPYFNKISYDQFFEKLNVNYDQEERRDYMREKVRCLVGS
jgi:hypothetical protein